MQCSTIRQWMREARCDWSDWPIARNRNKKLTHKNRNNTLLQQTGSQRPYRCCPLANKVENFHHEQVWDAQVWLPKVPVAWGRFGSPPNGWFLGLPRVKSLKGITICSSVFTARCYASAVLATGLCLSVCMSQVRVPSKRLNESSCFLARKLPFARPTLC